MSILGTLGRLGHHLGCSRGKKGGVGPWGAERGIFPNGRRIDGTRRYRGNGIGREQSSER